jgi:predicted phosphodiesterase
MSDTHNTRPALPPGDVLIHAGDLIENGSFEEVQAELSWLSSLPYRYKIFVAWNHDVLLDDVFLEKHPERRYGQNKTKGDLDWGSVIYLQDSVVTLKFPTSASGPNGKDSELERARIITVFGSLWTPRYGVSAFQYRPDDGSHWAHQNAKMQTAKPDIVVTHGPPKHHLDARDFHRAGGPYLAANLISQIRPRLVVFGHIHASYGREEVILDSVQGLYEEVMTGWGGWGSICWMALLVLWGKLTNKVVRRSRNKRDTSTISVNASMVGGPKKRTDERGDCRRIMMTGSGTTE